MFQVRSFNFLSIAILVFSSCGDRMSQSDRNAAREGQANQEIKKVNEADILKAAFDRGAEITDAAQDKLIETLDRTVMHDGAIQSLKYCNIASYPLMDSLTRKYSATIRRISLDLRNPSDAPDQIERQLLEAYQYSFDNSDQLEDNIQFDGDDYLIYTRPITIQNEMCLQCHGELGKELKSEVFETIHKSYPGDEATGYKLNDFRGMWSIRLLRKEIVKAL